ncbi:putative solute carrier family 13 [Helianthus annuus]|nr:putative solute carrier family 13 [Helianthus annuus]
MGLLKKNKWMMLGTMLVTVTWWIFGERLDISALAAAMMGLSVVLILRVRSIHYLIVGQTTHIGALYQAILKMHLTAKVPGTLSTLLLAYNTDLFGALTHYSSGYAAIYYGAGYVKLWDFFKLGILMAFINMTIWGLVGALWWKIIGLYSY